MSPVEIKILLHYYVHPYDYDGPETDSLVTATISKFIRNDLLAEIYTDHLTDEKQKYELTDRGWAYCEMLQEVPIPIIKYVDPRMEKKHE